MPRMSQGELDAAFRAVRRYVDGTQYGSYISDTICRELAQDAVQAAEDIRKSKETPRG